MGNDYDRREYPWEVRLEGWGFPTTFRTEQEANHYLDFMQARGHKGKVTNLNQEDLTKR